LLRRLELRRDVRTRLEFVSRFSPSSEIVVRRIYTSSGGCGTAFNSSEGK
jgi:hypothetical protein